MRDKKREHRDNRGSELFDVHSRVRGRAHKGKGRFWRFGGAFGWTIPKELDGHVRPTAWVLALDSGHQCDRQEAVRQEHEN